MLPEVQKTHFDYEIDQNSPTMGDVERVVKHDEKGQEVIAFEGVNYLELLKSRPTVEYYSLDAMLKAGVNPDVPIRTGLNSRIEGVGAVEGMAQQIIDIFEPTETKDNE